MVDVDLSIIFAGLSIAASIVYYASVLRNANKAQEHAFETRNAQFFLQTFLATQTEEGIRLLWNEVYNKDWSSSEEWWERNGPENNIEAFSKWLYFMAKFEMYGIMVKKGFMDLQLVDDTFSGAILMAWELYEPIIMHVRENLGYPQFQEFQEYLTDEIKGLVEKHHPDFEGKRQA